MVSKPKRFNRQFKTRGNSGEYRNGRLAQFKNHSIDDDGIPDEYVSKKPKDE
ncbi:hypothetical protein QS257_01915 [Terrilactibacillus sp. S3-3]|nr:hypothetical protein QS257_01915 [Terrilactibacillus sp. S3-3]